MGGRFDAGGVMALSGCAAASPSTSASVTAAASARPAPVLIALQAMADRHTFGDAPPSLDPRGSPMASPPALLGRPALRHGWPALLACLLLLQSTSAHLLDGSELGAAAFPAYFRAFLGLEVASDTALRANGRLGAAETRADAYPRGGNLGHEIPQGNTMAPIWRDARPNDWEEHGAADVGFRCRSVVCHRSFVRAGSFSRANLPCMTLYSSNGGPCGHETQVVRHRRLLASARGIALGVWALTALTLPLLSLTR
jgi:hypothetical protein